MTASVKAYDLIKRFEGLRLEAYRCPAGVLTIGYGHTKDVRAGLRIDTEKANSLLKSDIEFIESQLNALDLKLTQNQYDALVSFIFNVGFNNFRQSTLLTKIRINPNDNSIMDEFLRWVYAGGKVLVGLQRRRLAEMKLYFSFN